MHARTKIRAAVAGLLEKIDSWQYEIAGIHSHAIVQHAALPDITITTPQDVIVEEDLVKGQTVTRLCDVTIEVRAKQADDAEIIIDTICSSIEARIAENESLDGLVEYIMLESTTIDISPETDQPVALATMVYNAQYRINRDDPETII